MSCAAVASPAPSSPLKSKTIKSNESENANIIPTNNNNKYLRLQHVVQIVDKACYRQTIATPSTLNRRQTIHIATRYRYKHEEKKNKKSDTNKQRKKKLRVFGEQIETFAFTGVIALDQQRQQ
jgi:hypothetical protein